MYDQDLGLDIRYFWDLVQASRIGILVSGVLFLAGAIIVALNLPTQYKARAITIIADEQNQSPTLGGLASTFLDMGTGSSNATFNVEYVKSFQFMNRFISQHSLQGEVFPNKWDSKNQKWRETLNPDDIPSQWVLVGTFSKQFSIDHDIRTNIVRFGFKGRNPEKSAQITNDFIALANEVLLRQALSELDISIQSIQDQYEKEGFRSRREMLIDINERYESEKNLLMGKREYAFRIIDKAFPPFRRDRSLQILIILLAGGLWASFSAMLITKKHMHLKSAAQDKGVPTKDGDPHGG